MSFNHPVPRHLICHVSPEQGRMFEGYLLKSCGLRPGLRPFQFLSTRSGRSLNERFLDGLCGFEKAVLTSAESEQITKAVSSSANLSKVQEACAWVVGTCRDAGSHRRSACCRCTGLGLRAKLFQRGRAASQILQSVSQSCGGRMCVRAHGVPLSLLPGWCIAGVLVHP